MRSQTDTMPVVVGETPFVLRLPPVLKAELERRARKNRRSLNAEILIRLEESIEREGQDALSRQDMHG